jgi:hypothetical protein
MHVSSRLAPITMHVTVVAADGLRGMRHRWKTRHQQSRHQKRDLAHSFLPTLGERQRLLQALPFGMRLMVAPTLPAARIAP